MHIPDAKKAIVEETEANVIKIEKKYQRGLLREEERYNAVINAWDDATDKVTETSLRVR